MSNQDYYRPSSQPGPGAGYAGYAGYAPEKYLPPAQRAHAYPASELERSYVDDHRHDDDRSRDRGLFSSALTTTQHRHHRHHDGDGDGDGGYDERAAAARDVHPHHHDLHYERERKFGAAALGAAGGGFLGHELGGGAIATIGGAIAGAIGVEMLEKHHLRRKGERREGGGEG
ncbi:MAG: hypothetical protein M1826_003378 [Phylliscum demangeonii]|nr:MAG: hypothetical protein M1826_003378 [Phylliscum demangeonii]